MNGRGAWGPFGALCSSGFFAPLDLHLAEQLSALADERDPLLRLTVALASRQTREGHTCLDLATWAGQPLPLPEGVAAPERFPELSVWWRCASGSRLVSPSGAAPSPLVLEPPHRVYLRRYWEHERALAANLLARVGPRPPHGVDAQPIAARLNALFERLDPSGAPNAQRLAAALALLGRLCVVSGGPGTGKTSTVVRLLCVLIEQARLSGAPAPRIALLAPTGKAAARLLESIERAKASLPVDEAVRAAIPSAASTIHRALRPRRGSMTRFEHDRKRPLPLDLVVVDECSMVDVALMRRLLDAIPERARVVLLGDKDQLASVEAGSVFGDVSAVGRLRPKSQELAACYQELLGEPWPGTAAGERSLADSVAELSFSYRFRGEGGIGQLAQATRDGELETVQKLLGADGVAGVRLIDPGGQPFAERELARALIEGYRGYLAAKNPRDALAAFDRFRVLCAHRHGPVGVGFLNEFAERVLHQAGLLRPNASFYTGRPVLVTSNDYQVELFNGDIGLVWEGRVCFPSGDGGLRELSPSRLPAHETVFVMSVHKSQGSEFDEVAVVLPDVGSPLLTRELLYTAVTRARRKATLFGSPAAVALAVERRVQRASGLRERLLGSDG